MIVTLDNHIGYIGLDFNLFELVLNVHLTEVVRVNLDVVVVARLESESLWDHVLLREVEGTHWPVLVAFKMANRVFVAVHHSVTGVTLEQVEHFEELLPNLVHIGRLINFVLISDFLESVIGTVLDVLRVVNCLFLTDRSVEVDVLLL